jgi:hypothetical protein
MSTNHTQKIKSPWNFYVGLVVYVCDSYKVIVLVAKRPETSKLHNFHIMGINIVLKTTRWFMNGCAKLQENMGLNDKVQNLPKRLCVV